MEQKLLGLQGISYDRIGLLLVLVIPFFEIQTTAAAVS